MHEVEGSSDGRVVANELMNSNASGSGTRRSTNTSSSGSNIIILLYIKTTPLFRGVRGIEGLWFSTLP